MGFARNKNTTYCITLVVYLASQVRVLVSVVLSLTTNPTGICRLATRPRVTMQVVKISSSSSVNDTRPWIPIRTSECLIYWKSQNDVTNYVSPFEICFIHRSTLHSFVLDFSPEMDRYSLTNISAAAAWLGMTKQLLSHKATNSYGPGPILSYLYLWALTLLVNGWYHRRYHRVGRHPFNRDSTGATRHCRWKGRSLQLLRCC